MRPLDGRIAELEPSAPLRRGLLRAGRSAQATRLTSAPAWTSFSRICARSTPGSPLTSRRISPRAGARPFRALLLLSALLHDVAKPETARKIDGRLRFFEHDTKGAAATGEDPASPAPLARDQIATASAIVRHHLRPGHLAAAGPLTDARRVPLFPRPRPDAPGLLIVCWGDHSSYMTEASLKRLLKSRPPARFAGGASPTLWREPLLRANRPPPSTHIDAPAPVAGYDAPRRPSASSTDATS